MKVSGNAVQSLPILSSLVEKLVIYCYPMDGEEEADEPAVPSYDYSHGGSSDGGVPDRYKEKIDHNAKVSRNNRKRLIRIDERTAWMSRIIVSLFLAFLGALAAGLVVSFI